MIANVLFGIFVAFYLYLVVIGLNIKEIQVIIPDQAEDTEEK